MASKLLSSSLQDHNETSKQPLCKLSEGLSPPEIGQKHRLSFIFLNVFGISAFGHLAPPKQAFQAQNLPQDALLDPPRRAKEGPRWPKMGPRWAQKGARNNDKIRQDNSWSPLGPILGHLRPSKNNGFYNGFCYFPVFQPI